MRNSRKNRKVVNTMLYSGFPLNYLMQDFYPSKSMAIPANKAFAEKKDWNGDFNLVPFTYWGYASYVDKYGKDQMGYIDAKISRTSFLKDNYFFFADFDNGGTTSVTNLSPNLWHNLNQMPEYKDSILHYSQLTPEIISKVRINANLDKPTANSTNVTTVTPGGANGGNTGTGGNTNNNVIKKDYSQYFIYAGVGLMAYLLYDKFVK